MGDKNDGLGLSLSWGYDGAQQNHQQQPSLKLNLMPVPSQNNHNKTFKKHCEVLKIINSSNHDFYLDHNNILFNFLVIGILSIM